MINILFLVAFQAFILSFLLFLNKKDKKEDYYLMTFFGATFLHAIFKMALSYFFNDLIFDKVHASFSLLYGPILYFCFAEVKGIKLTDRKVFYHIIPFLFSSLINISFVIYLILNQGEENDQLIEIYELFSMILFIPSLVLYPLYCFKKTGFVFDFKDDSESGLWRGIIQTLCFLLLFSSGMVVSGLFFAAINFQNPINMRYCYYAALLVSMIVALNYRIKLSHKKPDAVAQAVVIEKPKEKYKNYDLNEDEMGLIINKIDHCFKTEKLYLDADFNLDILAKEIKTPKIKITQALNIKLDTNFYGYINTCRIEESKMRIKNSEKPNLIDISFECGFKNKSTFYKNFKLLNGITPKEYHKSLSLDSVA